jgi:ribosome-associated toxin RatA of RatAB toxin-antitoxin module
MPTTMAMRLTDELVTSSAAEDVFHVVRQVEKWPSHLRHYRYVRFRERTGDGGGLVEMSANRPFGALNWPTWWLSEMTVDNTRRAIRFRHVGGITTGMDVEWSFTPVPQGTLIRLVHVWDGPRWPLVGRFAAVHVIGPVFINAIAARTMAGLADVPRTPPELQRTATARGFAQE